MSTREELQIELNVELNMLAMYCQRVAEVREANSIEADQARQLKREWDMLIGSIHPKDEIEAQTKRLRERMLRFLSTVELPILSRRSSDHTKARSLDSLVSDLRRVLWPSPY